MSNFDFTVDTSPMADRVDSVNKNVVVVGSAITAMQAAVVSAQNKTADYICKNLDGGFFLLIRSKLSQKITQFRSTINARLLELNEQAVSLDGIHTQMENDFFNFKRRYAKLFNGLDKELESRVRMLDAPASNIAELRSDLILNRIKREAGSTIFRDRETHETMIAASSAHMKSRTLRSIHAMNNNIREAQSYGKRYESASGEAVNERREYFIPVVYAEEESLYESGNYFPKTYIADEPSVSSLDAIRDEVLHSSSAVQENSERESTEIRTEFFKLIEKESVEKRIADEMVRLLDGGKL